MHLLIEDAAEGFGGQSGAVDNYISLLSGVMGVRCVSDVFADSSFEHSPILDTLANQPWQVDGCIDADRCPFLGIVNPGS